MLQDGSAKQEEEHVGQHDAVTGAVVRLLSRQVDIGGDDTVHVTPSNDNTDHDTALEIALDVVGCPGQGVGDGRVDAHGAQEGSGILDVHVGSRKQHDKSDAADEGDDHVAVAAPLGLVGNPTNDYGHGSRDGIWRNGQELRFGTGVTHTEENRGKEQGEAVQWAKATHVADGVDQGLDVSQRFLYVAAIDVADSGAGLSISAQTTLSSQLLFGAEEAGRVWEIENHPPAEDADEDGDETLNNEDPAPALVSANAVHLGDGSSQETTEGTSKSSGREEKSSAETELLTLVPATSSMSVRGDQLKIERYLRKVVVDTREQTSLCDTKEESARVQTSFVVNDTHQGHDDTPDEDDGGEEDARRPPLDSNVGEGLETGVRDEENGEGNVVVVALHFQGRLHLGNTSITDVCSVQERQEVQERQPWDQPAVHFPHKSFVLGEVSMEISREERHGRTSLARSSSLLPTSGSGSSPS